jgi:hypothetical protein
MKCYHQLQILRTHCDVTIWCVKCGHAIEGKLEEEE